MWSRAFTVSVWPDRICLWRNSVPILLRKGKTVCGLICTKTSEAGRKCWTASTISFIRLWEKTWAAWNMTGTRRCMQGGFFRRNRKVRKRCSQQRRYCFWRKMTRCGRTAKIPRVSGKPRPVWLLCGFGSLWRQSRFWTRKRKPTVRYVIRILRFCCVPCRAGQRLLRRF